MKFVQSFWSIPLSDSTNKDNWNFRHDGGFPNSFLFYCSWMYSCLTIKKFYPNLHLVTDDKGIHLFKYLLNLPYVSFSNALNDLNDYPKGVWALGKLYTYRLQDEPFCHIDGDVFLFGSVLDSILNSSVFCQGYDYNSAQYAEIHPYVHEHFEHVPPEYGDEPSSRKKLINAGVIGGSNLELFQLYTSKAFELIDKNIHKLEDINVGLFNLYYEQFLFSNILAKMNLEAAFLYPKADDEVKQDFAAFHGIPNRSQYVHLVSHLKKQTEYIEQVVARLQLEFPTYYNRLRDLHENKEL